ncbi:ImmA/IrrE family metallo-endopeptidase [Robertmurraya sp. FSL W8-0741]|uniref:ImmA/IrrE family metallo-endopeptidase n=1 Tax=Robertmurraya sp. FSL W8-0741 TaxID=2954629 RepID=UPI0030F5C755
MYTHLEDYIFDLYTSIGVYTPADLDMHTIAKKIGVKISYKSKPFRFDNEIILNEGTKCEEWMDFGHETSHYLRHCGNQLSMPKLFIDLQECQATHFAYHFCVPTFMLDNLRVRNVYEVMNLFNVDFDFALKRLEMYKNRQYYRKMWLIPANNRILERKENYYGLLSKN